MIIWFDDTFTVSYLTSCTDSKSASNASLIKQPHPSFDLTQPDWLSAVFTGHVLIIYDSPLVISNIIFRLSFPSDTYQYDKFIKEYVILFNILELLYICDSNSNRKMPCAAYLILNYMSSFDTDTNGLNHRFYSELKCPSYTT